MLELKAGAFYEATIRLVGTASWVGARSTDDQKKGGVFHKETILDDRSRTVVRRRLRPLAEFLDVLGARVTSMAVREAEETIARSRTTWGDARTRIDDITNTLTRELTLTTIIVLEPRERSYFSPNEPLFGAEVASKFQSHAMFEIDEAAKCLALGRSTASVFHLMRVMEIGVRTVAKCLGIPDPIKPSDRNWGRMLNNIWDEGIARKWPTPTDRATGDGEIFESLYASLDAVKNPWRNATMHVENKYTNDEAEHIFVAVRGFMKKLASRMDEQGLPRA